MRNGHRRFVRIGKVNGWSNNLGRRWLSSSLTSLNLVLSSGAVKRALSTSGHA